MKTRIQLSVSVWAVLLFLAGCTSPDKELTHQILAMPREQRGVALSRWSGQKQVDIYLYAYHRIKPPVILAGEVAENWHTTLPAVTARLSTEDDEVSTVALMMVLSAISSQHCSLADRADVLTVAQQAAGKIRPPDNELAERQLERMRKPEKQLPPCQ